ncbi:MAG: OmpA family protein [Bacteroidota bacterium]
MKRFLLFSLSLIILSGCSKLNYKTGNDLYKQEAYASAIPYFQKVVEQEGNSDAYFKLADSYNKVNNYEDAEAWYAKIIELGIQEPEHIFQYARTLQKNGKYEEAKMWYTNYSAVEPNDERVNIAMMFLNNLDDYLKPSFEIEVNQLSINSSLSDFAPSFYKDGIIYCSEQGMETDNKYNRTGRPYVDMYYSKFGPSGDLLEPVSFHYKLNTEYHDGPAAYDKFGKKLFFTRSNLKNNKSLGKSGEKENHLQLYVVGKSGSDWGTPQSFIHNSKEYSTGHATLSEDGKTLYFISNMPGGKGGTDLYKSTVDTDGRWTTPENLGDLLNTPGDEMFPFFVTNADGEVWLYFASDGRPGLGGLDIFKTNFDGTSWTQPEILPAPINSSKDDFGIITDGEEFAGYFSSNRANNGEIDNLYKFGEKQIHVKGLVVDQDNGAPLPDAEVGLRFEEEEEASQLEVSDEARFHFDMGWNDNVDISAFLKDYLPENVNLAGAEAVSDTINIMLELLKLQDIVLIGVTKDARTGRPLEGTDVSLLDVTAKRMTNILSGENGAFQFTLKGETDFLISGKKPNYYLDRKSLSTKGLTAPDTIFIELNLNRFEIQKPIVLENIYYDFDKSFIRQDAAPELDKLAQMLLDNPEITIELMSHTDSRASHKYNQRLSQRRANAALSYLVKKGIDKSKIVAKGYGEQALLNYCTDGIPCSELDHQRNRRTEFKIIKVDETILSVPREDVPINTGLRAED